MDRKKQSTALFLLILLLGGAIRTFALDGGGMACFGAERPACWAVAVLMKGVPNCHKVSDFLYRGGQPVREGFKELEKMGIKTIVNLREHHSDKKLIDGTGLNYYQVFISTTRPNKKDYQRALDIIRDPRHHPVFIHCLHGADRTGTAVALYRITAQRWDVEEAIRELKDGGYGYHSIYMELLKFIRNFSNQH